MHCTCKHLLKKFMPHQEIKNFFTGVELVEKLFGNNFSILYLHNTNLFQFHA